MKFDEARFARLLAGLGLSSPQQSGKIVYLYQGKSDTVVFGSDVICISGAEIQDARLVSGSPKLSFQELESILGLSERIKTAGFSSLTLELRVDVRVTGVSVKSTQNTPVLSTNSADLVGIPASPGIAKGTCLVLKDGEDPRGRIVILKNSKDLFQIIRQKPQGIILEEGNLLSHASILAREAKIPAIVKVKDATKRLSTGDVVELDATRGLITLF